MAIAAKHKIFKSNVICTKHLWNIILIYSYPSLDGVWISLGLGLTPYPMVNESILAQCPTNVIYK